MGVIKAHTYAASMLVMLKLCPILHDHAPSSLKLSMPFVSYSLLCLWLPVPVNIAPHLCPAFCTSLRTSAQHGLCSWAAWCRLLWRHEHGVGCAETGMSKPCPSPCQNPCLSTWMRRVPCVSRRAAMERSRSPN